MLAVLKLTLQVFRIDFDVQRFAATGTTTKGTGNVLANKLVVDMDDEIYLLEPNKAPLTLILSKLRKERPDGPKPEWLEDALHPRWDTLGAAILDGVTTSVTVTNGAYFTVGDVIKIPVTGEQLLVTAIATNVLTVVRGFGETAAAAASNGAAVTIIGSAFAEGTGKANLNVLDETPQFNYTQIFKTTVGVTNTLKASKLYGPNDLDYQRRKKGIDHAVKIEQAFLFGERKLDTSGTQPKRTTRGILKWITSNLTDAAGTLTESELEQFCEKAFRYSNNRKVAFCGARAISTINQFAAGKLQMVPKDETYGIHTTRYVSGHGELLLVKHHLLENYYAGYMVVLDMEQLAYCALRDTKLETNVQLPDADETVDQYVTEVALKLKNEKKHAVLYNVTG